MSVHETAVVDAALKDLELHCSLGLSPGVPLQDEQAILIHNAAVKLGEACSHNFIDYTSPARVQLVEKVQVPRRLGSVCRALLQHKQLRTLGGTLLGPLVTLGTMSPPGSRGGSFEIMFATQLARSGLLAEIPGLINATVAKFEAALKEGTPITVEVIASGLAGMASLNSSGRRRGSAALHSAGASSSSSGGSSSAAAGSNSPLSSYLAGQHESACFGLVSNLLQFVECLHVVWPGNLLTSGDVGPVFKPATQLALVAVRHGNSQVQQLAAKGQVPSCNLFRMLYSAFRLCPCLCSVLARHGTRVGDAATIVPAAAELMASPSFRQCALLYMVLQVQVQLIAPQYGWLSPAEKAHHSRSNTTPLDVSRNGLPASSSCSGSSKSRRNGSGSSGGGARTGGLGSPSSSARSRRGSAWRASHPGGAPPTDAPVDGIVLEAWHMAGKQQEPQLLPSHEALLEVLGVSRLLLLWMGCMICMDPSQPSLQHAVLQQTLLVEVLDVYRSCWQPQLNGNLPLAVEVQQLQQLPCMLLQWANGLRLPTDTEDYVFCAIGAAFSCRFALRTWVMHKFISVATASGTGIVAAADADNGAGEESAAAAAQEEQEQQGQQLAAPGAEAVCNKDDDECFDQLLPQVVQLLQRLLPQVVSAGPLVPSTCLAPVSPDLKLPVQSRTAAEAFKQACEVLDWLGSSPQRASSLWRRHCPQLSALLQTFIRTAAAGPSRPRAQVALSALRGLYVHDVIPKGVSSFVLSGPLLQLSMAAGAGSADQALLHGLLHSSLKLSSSYLPEHQFAYLELVSSITAAAQAVVCAMYEAAATDRPARGAAAAAAPAAMLPWVSLLGRCIKHIAVLIDLLLQCKLVQTPMWANGEASLPPGAPGNLALWLYMTAVSTCTRLLHLLLTLLSPMAVELPQPKDQQPAATALLADEQQQQLVQGQQHYLLQLSEDANPSSRAQQQQQQDACPEQALDQAPGALQEALKQQQQHQPQLQQQPAEQLCVVDQKQRQDQQEPMQHQQQQEKVAGSLSSSSGLPLRQQVWAAAEVAGVDVKTLAEPLHQAYSRALAADAALQRYFDAAVLLQMMQPPGVPMPQELLPGAAAADDARGCVDADDTCACADVPAGSDAAVHVAAAAAGGNGGGGDTGASSSAAAAAAAAAGSGGGDMGASSSAAAAAASGAGQGILGAVGAVNMDTLISFAEDDAVAQLVPALQAAGNALCTVPTTMACNNPSCSNLAKESEQQMVNGRGCICGGCKLARYCGKQCQNAHWKAHRPVCKAAAKQQQLQEAPSRIVQ